MAQGYLSTDPTAGQPVTGTYLSTDPNAGEAIDAPDTRSPFARGIDAASEPTAPGRWIKSKADQVADWMSAPRLGDAELNEQIPGAGTVSAALRGGAAGVVQGVGDVAAGFSSPLGLLATLSGVGAAKTGAAGFINAARALRGVEVASGAAFGARGVEQTLDAPDVAGKALGIAQAASGALGVRGGAQGIGRLHTSTKPAAAPPAGILKSAPGYVAPEHGPAVPFGTEIPMVQAPDGSYVRSVPGEYAKREVRGLLEPVRGFVADDAGNVVPRDQVPPTVAGQRRYLSLDPDAGRVAPAGATSGVRAVPAAVIERGYEQGTFTGDAGSRRARLVPTQYSGDPNAVNAPAVDLTPAEQHALRWIKADLEEIPFSKRNFREAVGRGGDLEVSGGAAGAPIYDAIVGDVSTAGRGDVLRAIDNLLEGKHTPTGDLALGVARELAEGKPAIVRQMALPPDAGGELAGTRYARPSGSGASPVAQHTDDFAQFSAAVDDIARGGFGQRAEPLAGKSAKMAESQEGAEQLDELLRALYGEDEIPRINPAGHGTRSAGPAIYAREVGEEGAIDPTLLARLGLGGAGAAYGAATGEDTADRLKRAATFGAIGLAAPSLVTRQPIGAAAAGALRTTGTTVGAGSAGQAARQPIPPADPIPANRQRTMPVLTQDVQGAADDLLAQYGGFERQRRGVQSVERTEALADRIAVDPAKPVAPGTAFNAERMRAYQNATATLLKKQNELKQIVKSGKATAAQELEFAKTQAEAQILTASFRGAAAEAGRALHILRYQARILQSGDTELIREAAQLTRQGLSADLQAYYYSNILSGVVTHERNILGNVSNAVYSLAAHPFAVGADVVRSAVKGQPRQVFIGELPERIAGTVAALPRAFSDMLQTLKTGIPAGEVTTFDRPIRQEFRGGGMNPLNLPGRALEAVDDFFSKVAADQTLYGAAFAQAKAEGLQGPALLRRVADLKVNPSDAVLAEVQSQRARLLFRENPGKLAKAVLAAKREVPALGYVVPFVRVPANIIRQGFEASPAGFAMSAARQGGRAGADAMGRAALGSLVLAPLAYWTAMGKVTGDAPRDPGKRAAFYESGKRPNSIQIGDSWYSYQTIQPINVPLAAVASIFNAYDEAKHNDGAIEDLVLSAGMQTAGSLLDQSFLSGLSAVVDALGDPGRYGQRFLSQMATGFVPLSGALRTVAQSMDPTVRAPQSVAQAVQGILPGKSDELMPRLTRFGETSQRDSVLNVFKPSPVVNDPIADALAAAEVNLRPAQGAKEMQLGRGLPAMPLEEQERTTVGQASGRTVRAMLEAIIATPAYQQASQPQQKMMLERAIAEARGSVNEQVRRELLQRMMRGAAAPR